MAHDYTWQKKYTQVLDYQFSPDPFIHWFVNGETNLCYNALDRHLSRHAKKTALIYVPNEGESVSYSYEKLHREVCYCANMLKKTGLKKGDRVVIFMSMIPEAAIALLASLRLGFVPVVLNPLTPVDALAQRIKDSGAQVMITGNQSVRGKKIVSLKKVADAAMDLCAEQAHFVSRCIVFLTTDRECEMLEDRDVFWHDAISEESADCDPVWVNAEDPSFILYPRDLSAPPCGVVHSTAGYMVYAGTTFKYLFDAHEEDVCFGTNDFSNISGHSYVVFGPLLSGATTVIFEGALDYPLPDRVWEVVEKEKVSLLYTDPKALGDLKKNGELWPRKHNLSSLRLLGTTSGVVTRDEWLWLYEIIGKKRCPVIDAWCQPTSGGILIGAIPGAVPLKPASATVPFFGIKPKIVDDEGRPCKQGTEGYLVIEKPWPGMMRGYFGRPQLFFEHFFSRFTGAYDTRHRAVCDEDGYYWIKK